jgi:hypothetical protein
MAHGDLDGALVKIDAAMQIDPKNVHAYLLRGSIYGQKKLWTRAQHDYETALDLDPNLPIARFNLAELSFMQKLYENARPGFLSLEGDPEIGDLSAYKVFLCDLMTNHEADASKDLAAFNQAGKNPSYYYGNAAWSLSHDKLPEARGWLNSASQIYDHRKNALYSASLNDLAAIHAPYVTFSTPAGKKYDHVQATLEDSGLRVLTPGGWISVPFDQLPADLSVFPDNWQKQIATKRAPDTNATGVKVSSLTTKPGQTYTDVSVVVEDAGLRLHTATGWVSVPFDQLPDDLSALPSDLQKQISLKRPQTSNAATGTKVATLKTKQGQTYDNVDVIVEDADLRVHTATGWISVPFDLLPDDLSALPFDLQKQIALKRAPDAAAGIEVPKLTTRQGQIYEHVSIVVEDTGLRVHTATGWVSVPFDQLPDDLSTLPIDLQKQIVAKQPHVPDAVTGIPIPSLRTKQGQTYENVSVFVEDTGLRFHTATGWVSVPFEQLPDDLSALPIDLQKQISARRAPAADVPIGIKVSSLTTRQGQTYTNIDVVVETDGLRVHTPNGWITIPFDQLPADLSALPPDLRKQITAKNQNLRP